MSNRVGGIIELKINGTPMSASGSFTYGIGRNKKEAVVGADRVHGYKETPQVAFIEGEITDRRNLDLEALCDLVDATILLEVGNKKRIVLRQAWYAGDGTVSTEEGKIGVRFEGISADEIS
jgi:hypothetical protein